MLNPAESPESSCPRPVGTRSLAPWRTTPPRGPGRSCCLVTQLPFEWMPLPVITVSWIWPPTTSTLRSPLATACSSSPMRQSSSGFTSSLQQPCRSIAVGLRAICFWTCRCREAYMYLPSSLSFSLPTCLSRFFQAPSCTRCDPLISRYFIFIRWCTRLRSYSKESPATSLEGLYFGRVCLVSFQTEGRVGLTGLSTNLRLTSLVPLSKKQILTNCCASQRSSSSLQTSLISLMSRIPLNSQSNKLMSRRLPSSSSVSFRSRFFGTHTLFTRSEARSLGRSTGVVSRDGKSYSLKIEGFGGWLLMRSRMKACSIQCSPERCSISLWVNQSMRLQTMCPSHTSFRLLTCFWSQGRRLFRSPWLRFSAISLMRRSNSSSSISSSASARFSSIQSRMVLASSAYSLYNYGFRFTSRSQFLLQFRPCRATVSCSCESEWYGNDSFSFLSRQPRASLLCAQGVSSYTGSQALRPLASCLRQFLLFFLPGLDSSTNSGLRQIDLPSIIMVRPGQDAQEGCYVMLRQLTYPMDKSGTIEFNQLSNKQLVCQCLDIITKCLFEALTSFAKEAKLPQPTEAADVGKIVGHFIERFDAIMDFLKVPVQSDRMLVKSWLHEVKYIRNMWAHAPSVQDRLVFRLYDTSDLLFIKLGANLHDPLYQRLQLFRNNIILKSAREIKSK